MITNDPQGTQARAIDTERKYPVHEEPPPPRYWIKQVLALCALIGIPLFLIFLPRWL